MPRTVTPARVPTGRGAADHSDHDSHCDTVSAAPVAGPRGRTVGLPAGGIIVSTSRLVTVPAASSSRCRLEPTVTAFGPGRD